MKRYYSFFKNRSFLISLLALVVFGCKKLIQIPAPVSSITTSQVFNDSSDASAAISGIYTALGSRSNIIFSNGGLSILPGLSADELSNFAAVTGTGYNDFYTNSLLATNGIGDPGIWVPAYQIIYQANACVDGIQASPNLSQTIKAQFIGEAKFIRAFCYFYLINIFGDVPYVTSITWSQTSLTGRTSSTLIYQQIIADLKDAQALLRTDYSISVGERIRANQSVATALLARVYLFRQQWDSAELASSAVINNAGSYSLNPDLNSVFLKNNPEAILQWNLNTSFEPGNATTEAYQVIPDGPNSPPSYYLNSQLVNAFELGDQRRQAWIDSTIYSGTVYYYPYKYKIGPAQYQINAASTEYYMVLRLAEQYLIRAEARAQQNSNLNGAIDDVNTIRTRAKLPALPYSLTQSEVLTAIAQERRIEFFAEWGHRWLDLKRTEKIDSVMMIATPLKNGGRVWNSYQQLYPIPYAELSLNPNLTQNTGF